jgi:uncharacterized OsmC-like protein
MKVTVQHVEELRFQATVGEHTVAVDAVVGEGEASSAMSPPQLFAAAVGACMLEFVANSCRLREIPFKRLSLELTCEELDRPRRLGPLEATLTIEPQPPEDVMRRLIGVAQHATLVNTLARPPEVTIQFAEE